MDTRSPRKKIVHDIGNIPFKSWRVGVFLGEIYSLQGEHKKAVKAYTTSLNKISTGNSDDLHFLLYQRVRCLVRLNQYEDALLDAKRMIELKPDDPKGLHQYANILFLQGRISEARDEYKRFLEINPTDPIALGFLEAVPPPRHPHKRRVFKPLDEAIVLRFFASPILTAHDLARLSLVCRSFAKTACEAGWRRLCRATGADKPLRWMSWRRAYCSLHETAGTVGLVRMQRRLPPASLSVPIRPGAYTYPRDMGVADEDDLDLSGRSNRFYIFEAAHPLAGLPIVDIRDANQQLPSRQARRPSYSVSPSLITHVIPAPPSAVVAPLAAPADQPQSQPIARQLSPAFNCHDPLAPQPTSPPALPMPAWAVVVRGRSLADEDAQNLQCIDGVIRHSDDSVLLYFPAVHPVPVRADAGVPLQDMERIIVADAFVEGRFLALTNQNRLLRVKFGPQGHTLLDAYDLASCLPPPAEENEGSSEEDAYGPPQTPPRRATAHPDGLATPLTPATRAIGAPPATPLIHAAAPPALPETGTPEVIQQFWALKGGKLVFYTTHLRLLFAHMRNPTNLECPIAGPARHIAIHASKGYFRPPSQPSVIMHNGQLWAGDCFRHPVPGSTELARRYGFADVARTFAHWVLLDADGRLHVSSTKSHTPHFFRVPLRKNSPFGGRRVIQLTFGQAFWALAEDGTLWTWPSCESRTLDELVFAIEHATRVSCLPEGCRCLQILGCSYRDPATSGCSELMIRVSHQVAPDPQDAALDDDDDE